MERCSWVSDDPLYQVYHDTEWGVPLRDPRALWEQLVLEGFQAGLSWITILRKRENFRAAFANFDPEVVAGWGAPEVAHLLGNAGIIRHRGKIEATIGNARVFLNLEARHGFDRFIWDHVEGTPIQNNPRTVQDVPTQTPVSVALSKALKKEGFRFCGPTTAYAFMQAAGLVNDHTAACHRHDPVAALGAR